MVQGGCGFRFVDEPLLAFEVACDPGTENLDRHRAIQTHVASAIHFAHPARPEQRDHLVRPETIACRERHWLFGVRDVRRNDDLDSRCLKKGASFVMRCEKTVDLGQERWIVPHASLR